MADRANKGNPASKRMSNPNRKARRAASWLRGEKRKARRREKQQGQEAVNRILRRNGEPTPWEAACQARRERRHPAA